MIYIVVFLSSTFFAYLAGRSKNKGVMILCSVISILIPCILGGLRHSSRGFDTTGYGMRNAMEAKAASDYITFMTEYEAERGYLTVAYVVMNIFGHPNWCFFAYQLITISCVYIGAYRHRKLTPIWFTMFIFLMFLYNNTYDFIRQDMAAAIIFMGLDKLERKQYYHFSLYILAAFLFHYSAVMTFLIVLGLYVLSATKISGKYASLQIVATYIVMAALIFARPIIYVMAGSISFLSKYLIYFTQEGRNVMDAPVWNSLMCLIAIMMCYFFKDGAVKAFETTGDGDNMKFYRNNTIFFLMYSHFIKFFSARVMVYTNFINILLMASLPSFVKEKNLRIIVALGVMFFWSVSWYVRIVIRNQDNTYPYISIL